MAALFDNPDSPLWVDEANVVVGGIVNNTEPHLLSPDQAVRLLNINPTVAGRREKRLGVHAIGTGADGQNPNSLHEFYSPVDGLDHLLGQWGSGLYKTTGDDTWSRVASACSLCNTPHMSAQGRGAGGLTSLFLASCVGVTDSASLPYGYLVSLTSGWAATPATDVRPRSVAWFQGRNWVYNSCQTNHGSTYLTWSKPLDGSDFSHGEGFHVVPNSADIGTVVLPCRDGTPRLFLFNERSVYQFDIFWETDGYYPASANAIDFTKASIRPLVVNTGCIAPRACIWVPGQNQADVLFLSREGIRALSRSATDAQSGAPLPLSFRIQPTIDRINWTHAERSCAAFWDGYAYFSVPVDGAVDPNFIIAYDVHRDAFLELDLDVNAWAEARLGSARHLYFMSGTAGTEIYPGAATGVSHGAHVYKWATGNVDPFNAPIHFTEETRAFDFSSSVGGRPGDGMKIKKKFNYFDFAIQSGDTGCTLTIDYKVDDDQTWNNLGYIYVDPDTAAPYLPVQLPFGFGSGKIVRKTLLARKLQPGYKVQLRLDETSYARIKLIAVSLYANPCNPKITR